MTPFQTIRPDFAELLWATVPNTEGVLVLLRAYVDASQKGDVFCVAAVAIGYDRAIKAEREWVALYGNMPDGTQRHGHMTDLHGRRGQFTGINDAEADRLCRGSVAIINEYASFVVAISCDVSEVVPNLPVPGHADAALLGHAHRGIYPACLHWAMVAMGTAVARPQGISYWIEEGDEFSGSASVWLNATTQKAAAPLKASYSMASYSFLAAENARLFEAADLVAWEWATHITRLKAGQPIRPSLKALMNADCLVGDHPFVGTPTRYANHYFGHPLHRYLSKVQRLMDVTSHEAVDAIVAETVGR